MPMTTALRRMSVYVETLMSDAFREIICLQAADKVVCMRESERERK
jgi:hypothetical protein